MSDPVGLMQAVLGLGTGRSTAANALRKALASGVDPLHWCAVHFRNPPHRIMQRAAHWSSLPFAEAMPPPELGALRPSPLRFDQLSGIRLVAHRRESAALAYTAPDFFGFLRIADALKRDPALRERLCVVPYDVLRDHLIESLSSDLVHASRQTLPRHWPFATAQLDLTKPMRWGFALFMVLLTALVVVAPFTQQVWLIPFWVTAMVLPTMLRLAALATPQRSERAGRAVASEVLPIYSILVPLRDEANMVDQLCASLARLDYPALCRKRM